MIGSRNLREENRMSTLVLLVELTINAGQMDAFQARAEPDCKGFELLVPVEGGDTVFLYEVYADQAAIDHHMGTPYMKEYMADTAPMIAQRNRRLCTLAST
jgi:quinol monooxygenase YgiN